MELDKEKFKEWLESSSPEQIVGVRFSANNCPLAKWTKAEVYNSSFRCTNQKIIQLPTWAIEFVERLEKDFFKLKLTKEVSSKEGLEILAEIKD